MTVEVIVLQIIKSKARKSWPSLLAAILFFAVGLVLVVLSDEIVEVILAMALSAVLIVYGTVRMVYCWRRNELTQGAVTVLVCYAVAVGLVGVNYKITSLVFLPSLTVGLVSLILGIMRLLICISCIKNRLKGAFRNGFSALICIAFGLFLVIHPIKNFSLLSRIAGFYMIFYAVTMLGDFIAAVSKSDLNEDKIKRRAHFALPNLYTAIQPARMILMINKSREEGKIVGGMLIEQKPDTELDTVNVEILVHLTTQGTNKFGHVDLAIKDKVYSYGTYDSSKVKMGGFVAQGTFIVVPKIPYLKHCLDYQQKYVIGFGASLSEKQLASVQKNIDELLSHCEPLESLYEQAVKKGEDGSELNDPASNIVRDVGGKVYTVVEGPFKRYFGINTNCVRVADWLLTDSGVDRLTFNAISTPGGYYSMLDNMFYRKNTRIIRRTAYIVADEIDDLEELRALARETAAEMKKSDKA